MKLVTREIPGTNRESLWNPKNHSGYLGEVISFKASRRGELSSLASLSHPVFVPPRRERAEERGLVSRTEGWKSSQEKKGVLKRGEREGREGIY